MRSHVLYLLGGCKKNRPIYGPSFVYIKHVFELKILAYKTYKRQEIPMITFTKLFSSIFIDKIVLITMTLIDLLLLKKLCSVTPILDIYHLSRCFHCSCAFVHENIYNLQMEFFKSSFIHLYAQNNALYVVWLIRM